MTPYELGRERERTIRQIDALRALQEELNQTLDSLAKRLEAVRKTEDALIAARHIPALTRTQMEIL